MQAFLGALTQTETATALCGVAAAAAWWVWSARTSRGERNGDDQGGAILAFEAAWAEQQDWDVARWDANTVHAFLSGHPRLAPLRPFPKALWRDIDGESLLAMTGADFTDEKKIPSYAVRKLMRCVCDAAERLGESSSTAAAGAKSDPHHSNTADNLSATGGLAVSTTAAGASGNRNSFEGSPKPTQNDRIVQSVLACSYFNLLRRSEIDLLVLNAAQKTFGPSTTILTTGKPASFFSIVLEGSVQRVTRDDIVVDQGFQHFGEQFLVKQDSVPTTSVRAGADGCNLLMVSFDVWKNLLSKRELRWAIHANRRMMLSVRHRFGKYLQQVSFLADVDRSSLDVLGSLFSTQSFSRGDSILVQGEESKGFYLIMRGTVEILVPQAKDVGSSAGGSNERAAPRFGKGHGMGVSDECYYESRYLCDSDAHNYFGEVSLMSEGHHIVSASVIAAQSAMLLHISPQSFKQFLACTGDAVVKKLRGEATLRSRTVARELSSEGGCKTGNDEGAAVKEPEAAAPGREKVASAVTGGAAKLPRRRAKRFSELHPHSPHPMLVPHVASFTTDHDRAHDNIRVQLETGFAVPPTPAVELWAGTPAQGGPSLES